MSPPMDMVNVLKLEIAKNKNIFDEKYLFSLADILNTPPNGLNNQEQCGFLYLSPTNYSPPENSISSYVHFEDIYSGVKLNKIVYNNIPCIKNSRNEKGNEYILCSRDMKFGKKKTGTLKLNGYSLSLFLYCLSHSHIYVDLVTKNLISKINIMNSNESYIPNRLPVVKINLVHPEKHIMDMIWARMACTSVHELRLLQYAMSWLSTLGGAFSALGEEQERCARVAGKISVEQLKIALKLGNDIIITQCKLYFSLSLIQRGYCKRAKQIILEQYHYLKSQTVVDKKTVNMCKGIWARLKYELFLQRTSKLSLSI